VFHSAVHGLAREHYTVEQRNAWSPQLIDQDQWILRMRGIRPFVVESDDHIVAYADAQPDGYIDHFYVSAPCARQGMGTLLMRRIHEAAGAQGMAVLTSDVSLTAQPFFKRFGFSVLEHRFPVIRGVVVPNAFMRKDLRLNSSMTP
jgi:putative acetyltransferase